MRFRSRRWEARGPELREAGVRASEWESVPRWEEGRGEVVWC